MKILFVADNFVPEVNAPANRTFEHCREWVKRGHQVQVITCAPNFPQGRVYAGYKNRLIQHQDIEGIKVTRVWSYIAKNAGFVRRVADYLSFAATSFVAGLFQPADVIVVTSPQFFASLSGFFLSVCKRKPWVFEVRDLWPESIEAVGAMRRSFALRCLERLELYLYRKASRIVVVTEAFKANMVGRGIDGGKISVIKNGICRSEFVPGEKDSGLAELLGINGKRVVAYIGTHGMAHRLDFILDCAQEMQAGGRVHFLLIGDGAEKEALLKKAEALKLKNVTMLAPVPRGEVARYLNLADIALVNLKKISTFKSVLPSKIFESAAMRKPILLGVDGEARALVESYKAGVFFEPENKQDFLAKLTRLVTDEGLYRECQQGCDRLADDFNREKLAGEMLGVLEGLR